jgi:Zn-dependent M28 family amino/carboxypeptidase
MSGTAGLMELANALQSTGLIPNNKIHFLSYGGSHQSSISGYTHYVDTLSEDERASVYLELQMRSIGSPNYGRFVRTSNRQVNSVFSDFFDSYDLTWFGNSEFSESSDPPFADISSGLNANKTEYDVCLFGGTAEEQFAT